jgi:hypothetical protein
LDFGLLHNIETKMKEEKMSPLKGETLMLIMSGLKGNNREKR